MAFESRALKAGVDMPEPIASTAPDLGWPARRTEPGVDAAIAHSLRTLPTELAHLRALV